MEIEDVFNSYVQVIKIPSVEVSYAQSLQIRFSPIPKIETVKLGEVLIQTTYVGYNQSTQNLIMDLGSIIQTSSVAKVLFSRCASLEEGDIVYGFIQCSKYQILNEDKLVKLKVKSEEEALKYLTVFGSLGSQLIRTLQVLGDEKIDKNSSIVITNASTGENLCLIQLIKLKYDVEAIAVVHNDQQRDIVYKYTSQVIKVGDGNLNALLKQKCPKGINFLVDSYGGLPLEQCLGLLRARSQVILLNTLPGKIINTQLLKVYNQGVASLGNLISTSSKLQGSSLDQQIIVKSNEEMLLNNLKIDQTIYDGIDNTQQVVQSIVSGETTGFQIVRVQRILDSILLSNLKMQAKL